MANTNISLANLEYYDSKIKNWATGQISELSSPEYSIVKAETAESGYTASYNLTKNGVNTGATINIPKDYLVKSATVKTVEVENIPVSGYKVGDKYIDFIVNTTDNTGNESHIYLLVNELVDVYTSGDGIEVGVDNTISLITQDGTKTVGGISSNDYKEFKGAATKSNANEMDINAIDIRVKSLEDVPYATNDDIDALFATTE